MKEKTKGLIQMKRLVGFSIGHLQNTLGDRKTLEIAAQIGADAVDFALHHRTNDYRRSNSLYSQGEEAIVRYYTDLRDYAHSLGLIISQTHGKLEGFRNIPAEDDALVENTRLDCIATAALGAPVCVVHTTTTIHMGPDAPAELMHRLNMDMFRRILPFAKENGIRIATETFGDATGLNCVDFFGDYEQFHKAYRDVKAIEELKDYLTICMDTGHTNKATRFGSPSSAEVIRRLGSEITILHLNDNDTLTDQHKIPMTGTLNWKDILDALDEIGYSGVYNMELNLRHFGEEMAVETAAFAIKVMRHMLKSRYGE